MTKNSFWLINCCICVVKINGIVENKCNCGLNYNFLMCGFFRIIGIFLVILLWKNN